MAALSLEITYYHKKLIESAAKVHFLMSTCRLRSQSLQNIVHGLDVLLNIIRGDAYVVHIHNDMSAVDERLQPFIYDALHG